MNVTPALRSQAIDFNCDLKTRDPIGIFSEKKDKMIMPVTQASIKQCADLGCHACRLTFSPSDVSEWVEGEATCPHCGSDAVIGSTEPIESMPRDGFADMLAKVFSGR